MRFPRTFRLIPALLLCVLVALPQLIQAQQPNFPSEPRGHVSDFAGFLNASETQRLESKLRTYRDTTTTVIAIATLQSLQGASIEETATAMFNAWNMWEDDRDNGVLILVSEEERQLRIEVGYGLEGAIPDVMAGRIIRNILTPSFRKGDYYEGFDRATSALIQLASGEFEGELTESRESGGDDDSGSLIVFLLFLAFVVYVSSRRGGGKGGGKGSRRRRTLGPGGFIFLGGGGFGGGGGGFGGGGGGFGGFGGGGGFGSGGGGASGGW
ncbi:MAG: TPM domain-containing protein [Balneolaceae bacterium]|nr:TPM domain-containing protein [Balneolaceae bacterium]